MPDAITRPKTCERCHFRNLPEATACESCEWPLGMTYSPGTSWTPKVPARQVVVEQIGGTPSDMILEIDDIPWTDVPEPLTDLPWLPEDVSEELAGEETTSGSLEEVSEPEVPAPKPAAKPKPKPATRRRAGRR